MQRTRLVAILLALVAAFVVGPGVASADPDQHFGTFEVDCGGHVLVIPGKPGSSTVISVDGQPSTSVTVLMAITVVVDGQVVFEYRHPYADKHETTICHELGVPAGQEVILELLITPQAG